MTLTEECSPLFLFDKEPILVSRPTKCCQLNFVFKERFYYLSFTLYVKHSSDIVLRHRTTSMSLATQYRQLSLAGVVHPGRLLIVIPVI